MYYACVPYTNFGKQILDNLKKNFLGLLFLWNFTIYVLWTMVFIYFYTGKDFIFYAFIRKNLINHYREKNSRRMRFQETAFIYECNNSSLLEELYEIVKMFMVSFNLREKQNTFLKNFLHKRHFKNVMLSLSKFLV